MNYFFNCKYYQRIPETNTKNLLLIHGRNDTLIFPEDNINFYNILNGDNRSDIELILREGLDHGVNENDRISLKLSILWFEHFYNSLCFIFSCL